MKGACLLGGLKAPGASPSPRQGAWGLAWKKWAASPGYWTVQRQLALGGVRGLPEGAGFVSCPQKLGSGKQWGKVKILT